MGGGDTERDVVLTLRSDDLRPPIVDAVRDYGARGRRRVGIAMIIDVANILRHVASGPRDGPGEAPPRRSEVRGSDHVLIAFIVNRGFADDAMVAARKAGAKGGTILHARGTGTEEDAKFFGITLVPEKEILLIVVESSKAPEILRSVKEAPFLAQPGSGIAFEVEVEELVSLGATSPE